MGLADVIIQGMSLNRRPSLARKLLLTILVLEMMTLKFGVKADFTDYLRDSEDHYQVSRRSNFIKINTGFQQRLLSCSLLEDAADRQECQLRLWLIDLVHKNKHSKLSTHPSFSSSYPMKSRFSNQESYKSNKLKDNLGVKASIPLEYLTVIENCIHKCDVWSTRVNYYNCLKSCKRENKIIQRLEDMSYEKCKTWPCEEESNRSMKPMVKRQQSGCFDDDCINSEQPRKRRWGDTLTTCIHSYCNSFSGVSRVDCIINKCDKQRRG